MPPDRETYLKKKASSFPQKPGIYFFLDSGKNIIYLGKARSLQNRIRSYFGSGTDRKIQSILAETDDINFILADSEKEAAFLENNFIRQLQPRFNIRLKDDKHFPYIKVTIGEPFPGIYLTRRIEADGARYFGPFSPAVRARQTIRLITQYFGLRTCREPVPGKRKRPCLEHDMDLCTAPCIQALSEKEYGQKVKEALQLLQGKTGGLIRKAKGRMASAVKIEDYEQAARQRDLMQALMEIKEKPRMISIGKENKDIIGFARMDKRAVICPFFMRGGKVLQTASIPFSIPSSSRNEDLLRERLLQYYYHKEDIPDQVLIPFPVSRPEKLISLLSDKKNRKVLLRVPRKGKDHNLSQFAVKNAEIYLMQQDSVPLSLKETETILQLSRPPRRIEGYDISNTGGNNSVGSVVVFESGLAVSKQYRRYRIRSVIGPNDGASLQEVLLRRAARFQDGSVPLPDLILIDGGKPQLKAAEEALREAGLTSIPLISLAKKEEIVFSSMYSNGLRLPHTSSALKLFQHIRDEAHRFALSYHRRLREKHSFTSLLDGIPGIGPKRKARLMAAFKDPGMILQASEKTIAGLIGPKAAEELKSMVGNPENKKD